MGRKAVAKDRHQDTEKKQEWATALFPFFQEYGVKGITINKMANWLGKSKSTLYEYFESKDEIIALSLLHKLENAKGYEAILQNEALSYRQRYNDFFQHITTQLADVSNLFLSDLKRHSPVHWNLIELFLQNIVQHLGVYYQKGMDAGEFKSIHTALLIAEDRHFIFELLTNPDFLEQNNLTLKELVEQYLDLKLNGFAV